MVHEHTVLVLGAGASAPYSFPTGRELVFRVLEELEAGVCGRKTGDFRCYRVLRGCDFSEKHIEEFWTALRGAMQPSVDAFLEHRPEFVDIGKAAIAACLIPHEDPDALLPRADGRDRWYEYLFNRMAGTREEFEHNRLSVITFNYDRSLEAFLYIAVQNSYGIDADDAVALLRTVTIVHPYGQMGEFPEGRPYSPALSAATVRAAAAGIKVVGEGAKDPLEFKPAQALLADADVVVFLGFGYHPANVERLQVRRVGKTGQRVMGSARGLTDHEIDEAKRLFNGGIDIDRVGRRCLDYLRDVPALR